MKYLKNFFENNFEIIKEDGNVIRNGIKFENLVEQILKCEFPNCTVKPTQFTHDGGKDFVIISENIEIWAECKNYKKSLNLKNIANTLVFAHLNCISEVLVFSYSKLTKNTLDSISNFFKHDNKIVRIYDDESLENLILFHFADLSQKIADLPKIESSKIKGIDYISAQIYTLKIDKDNVYKQSNIIPRALKEISENDIIGLDILIKNGTGDTNIYTININFGDDIYFINLFDKTREENEKYVYSLLPYEQKVFSFYYKICGLLENKNCINLPQVSVICSTKKINKNISFEQAKVIHTEKINFVGANHIKLKEKITSLFSNNNFKGVLLHGRSGTGKTRIVQEVLPALAIKNIRIIYLDIKEWNTFDNINIYRKIILKFFELPDKTDIDKLNIINGSLNDESAKIKEFIDNPLLLEDRRNIELLYKIIFKLNTESNICLAIDNLQYLDANILRFLYQLAILNITEFKKFIFIWILNDDYLIDDGSESERNIKQLFDTNEKYKKFEVLQFKDEDLTLFIREVLRCNKYDDISEIMGLLKHYSYNPYVLKSFLELLNQNELLTYRENKYYISPNNINENLFDIYKTSKNDNVRNNLLKPIKDIWQFFYHIYPELRQESQICISAIHFLGKLKKSDLKAFNISIRVIEALVKLHFLKFDSISHSYMFDHDIVELSFTYSIHSAEKLSTVFLNQLNGKTYRIIKDYSPFCEKYRQLYYYINEKSIRILSLDKIHELSVFSGLPSNIEKEYLNIHSRFLLSQLKLYPNKIEILSIFRSVASTYRERLGSEFLINLYNSVYKLYHEDYDKLVTSDIFGWFTIEYCNLLSDYGDLENAVNVMKEIIENEFYNKKNLSDIFIFLKAYYLNRLGGYLMKQSDSPIDNPVISEMYDESLRLSESLKDERETWAAEIQFINYTDKGYLNYYDKRHSGCALGMFKKASDVYNDKNLWQKTMNDFHKRIMIAMINKNYDEAVKIAEDGIAYCYTGTYHYYDGFFLEHYLLLQSSTFLMRKLPGDIHSCLDNIKRIKKTDAVIRLNLISMVYQLEGICAFYKGNEYEAMNKFLNAYLIAKEDKNKINGKHRLAQLKFNILKLNDIVPDRQLEPIIFKKKKELYDICIAINEINKNDYNIGVPDGIFTDYENKFNLPFI